MSIFRNWSIIAQAIFLLFFFIKADCSTRKLEHILEFVLQHQKYKKYIENDTVTLRFSFDGAKIAKNISSVRGVFKILAPRQSLPDNLEDLSMCPEDEFTLFFYIGEKLCIYWNFLSWYVFWNFYLNYHMFIPIYLFRRWKSVQLRGVCLWDI